MSDTVLGILVMATGVLCALGVRIGMPPANHYWRTKPTKFALISRIGGCLFLLSAGAFIAWHEKIPESYRIYFLFPFLLGFVLAAAGQAMEKRVNPGPTIRADATAAAERSRPDNCSGRRCDIWHCLMVLFSPLTMPPIWKKLRIFLPPSRDN